MSTLLADLRHAYRNLAADRTIGALSAALAVLATVLAAGGLYSVLSYAVAQRTRELGLRLALGAAPARLRRLVMGQVTRIGLIGGALGLIGALAAGHACRAHHSGSGAGRDGVPGRLAAGAACGQGRSDDGAALRIGTTRENGQARQAGAANTGSVYA